MFQKIPSMEKIMDKEGGFTFLRRNVFALHRRKTSWVNLSVFQKCSGIKIFLCSRGVTILSIFFVSQYRKVS